MFVCRKEEMDMSNVSVFPIFSACQQLSPDSMHEFPKNGLWPLMVASFVHLPHLKIHFTTAVMALVHKHTQELWPYFASYFASQLLITRLNACNWVIWGSRRDGRKKGYGSSSSYNFPSNFVWLWRKAITDLSFTGNTCNPWCSSHYGMCTRYHHP